MKGLKDVLKSCSQPPQPNESSLHETETTEPVSHASCWLEGVITEGCIKGFFSSGANAIVDTDGALMLSYIITTKVKISATDYMPGTTMRQVIDDMVTRETEHFPNLIDKAITAMREGGSATSENIQVALMASAHTGCELCDDSEECPIWQGANNERG